MSRRLRVVHVVPGMASGGAERQVEHLVERGTTDASVICLYLLGDVAEGMVARGHRVELLGMSGAAKATAVLRLAARLRALRPDVVHVHLLSAQLFGIPAARLAGLPVLSTEHSIMEDTLEGRPKTAALRRTYRVLERLASRTVAVSPATRRRLLEWGVPATRVAQIDNGVDLEQFAFSATAREQVRESLGLSPTARIVGAVGRLDPVKRLEPLLHGLAPLLREADDTHLVVAGHGPLRDQLAAAASRLGVADRVHLLGARPDVPRLLSAFDVLVSPSRDETFGLAVVEALASGLPVVYAQCPALDDLTAPSWVVHVPEDLTPELERLALAAGVARLLELEGRQPVPGELADRFSVDAFVSATEAEYAHLAR